LEFVHF